MANKYEIRRRARKDKEPQGRSVNPYASPRYGGKPESSPYIPPPPMDRRGTTIALCIGLFVLIVGLYAQTAGHKFTVCDDNVYIYEKPQIVSGLTWKNVVWAFSDAHEGNWHPLTWISHMLDWQMFSQGSWEPENHVYKTSWPGGHHLVGMFLHCANAVLLFLALRLLTGTLWPSFLVAVLFGVHPLRVESVAWAAERKDVLCGLFWMASMLTYAIYARRRPIYEATSEDFSGTLGIYGLLCVFFALGLLAKSMIVTLPCVFMLLDVWPLGRWKRVFPQPGKSEAGMNSKAAALLILEKIPLFAMVYGDCYITVYGQNKGVALNSFEGLHLADRLFNAVESCGEYLRQTFWPTGLAPFYAHPAMIPNGWTADFFTRFYIYAVLLLLITGAAVWFFRERPVLAVGWFWYLGALMPVIGIIQVGTQARADRYTYLPMIGVYLMVVWMIKEVADRWPATRISLALASALAVAALSAVTWRQVSYWVDSYQLFQHAAAVTDRNYFAYNHIGIAFDSDGKKMGTLDEKDAEKLFDEVSAYYQEPPKKLHASLKAPLAAAGAEHDFKAAAKKLNLLQKQQLLFDYSADAFQTTIDIKPDYDFGNNNLGVYYARLNEPEDLRLAEKYFRGALSSNQRYADAFNNLAIILYRQGKYDESIECHKAGLNVRIDRASDHNNLCRVYMARADQEAKNGQAERAKADLDSAMDQNNFALTYCDPIFLGAWLSRSEIYTRFVPPNYEEAGNCVLKMVKIDAKSVETIQALGALAQKYVDLHRLDDAGKLLSACLEINKTVPQIYRLRAIIYLQKGDLERAKEDLQKVVKLAPSFPGAQQMLHDLESKSPKPNS
jgi:protein O-mannosyl-transferase